MKTKTILVVIAATLGTIIIAGVCFGIYAWYKINDPKSLFSGDKTPTPANLVTDSSPSAPLTTPDRTLLPAPYATAQVPGAQQSPLPEDPQESEITQEEYEYAVSQFVGYDSNGRFLNVLLLGIDQSVERLKAGMNSRTDTMMLLTIDFDTKSATLISIPRDSYVRINGGEKYGKVNSAFVSGGGATKNGYAYAMKTVSWLLGGIPIDYYACVDMNGVKEIVDIIGGIDYDVDIEFTMNGRKTVTGFQHMDGQQVLDYCRFRKTTGGDFGRVDRQQRILKALLAKTISTGQIKNAVKIYNSVQKNLDTNLDVMQIAAIAYFMGDAGSEALSGYTLPGKATTLHSVSYVVIDQDKKIDMLEKIFHKRISVDQAEYMENLIEKATQDALVVSEKIGVADGAVASAEEFIRYASPVLTAQELEVSSAQLALLKEMLVDEDNEDAINEIILSLEAIAAGYPGSVQNVASMRKQAELCYAEQLLNTLDSKQNAKLTSAYADIDDAVSSGNIGPILVACRNYIKLFEESYGKPAPTAAAPLP